MNLKEGQMYRIVYLYTNGNNRKTRKTAVVKFLGRAMQQLNFSLRPLAGTSSIHNEQLISAQLLESTAKAELPRTIPKE